MYAISRVGTKDNLGDGNEQDYKKQFWLTKDENDKFRKKAEEFHDDIKKITEFITGLREHQLSTNEEILIKEISKWNIFQKQIYEKYMLIEGERDGSK